MSKFINLNIDFDKEIAPLLKEAHKASFDYSSHFVGFLLSSVAVVIMVTLIGIFDDDWDSKTLIQFAIIAIIIIGVGVAIDKRKDDENLLKSYSLDKILEKLNYTWGVDLINDELIQESKLFPTYDFTEKDDELMGCEDGFSIVISELSLLSRVSANQGSIHTDFKGLVLLYIFDKPLIEAQILLKPKKFLNLFTTPKGFQKIETKLNVINKVFEFYTNEEQKAQEFLTPAFLEKLSSVQERFNFSNLSCCISGNSCMIALHTKQDFFKLTSFELEDFKRQFNVLLKELQNISDFGKELKAALKI
ncbi:hypothetical protein B6S12_07155 [Helicobacter valdiviensis]|uniref:Galanin n=1 Tax=Helicobacter valdiviensis TaxID=1458358 RepID=A0A2W6MTH9_9HELI|nr:DUF3137 domain-containing protein [Helicobacter valdiviensis]PZT47777.1 hypothetical protein B6S12_07155 [Helicobacter valdiviensis]